MAQLVATPDAPPPANHSEVTKIASNVAAYIVKNGYYYIDVNGKSTRWGQWAPEVLNLQREWSDERGVNSLEVLGYICAGANYTGDPDGLFATAYAELTNSTNQYDMNVVNQKVEWPLDVNYGDDGLSWSAYITHLSNCQSGPLAKHREPVLHSLSRAWKYVRNLRSAYWNAQHAFLVGQLDAEDADAVAWNLRSWPLEQVDYPIFGSHRIDVDPQPAWPTWHRGTDRSDSMGILPANERLQYRWDVDNPHRIDTAGDSAWRGAGMRLYETGAFLLPYWMGRYTGIIQ